MVIRASAFVLAAIVATPGLAYSANTAPEGGLVAASANTVSTDALAAPAVDAAYPGTVIDALRELGFRAAQDTDAAGDPRIVSSSGGKQFQILFYGCENGVKCQSVQFSSGFDLEKPMASEQAENWNRANRFGKVILDEEGDPFLDFDVNLAAGGVSAANFQNTVALWDTLMGEFTTYIGW